MNIKLIFIVALYIFLINIRLITAKFDSNMLEKKVIALMKALKYIIKRPRQMNVDTIFGVTFIEANLQASLQNQNVKFLDKHQKSILKSILELAKDTQRILLVNGMIPIDDVSEVTLKINNPKIWIKPIIWKKLNLKNKFSPNPDLTKEEIINSMFFGHPQENESDDCLMNLVKNCQFTDECQNFMIHDNSTGYPLTHKLLMLQIINALQCESKISKFHLHLSYKLCSSIFQNLLNIEAMGFPFIGKDLASEQVFLCGMEGYIDFLDIHYEQLILDWQHFSGCYSGIRFNSTWNWGDSRRRRSGSFTDFGCVNHATSLGAATLSLLIRKDVEMLLES